MSGPTIVLTVQLDTERRVNTGRLARAVARAIEYALDNDLQGAELLNRSVIGQVTVLLAATL